MIVGTNVNVQHRDNLFKSPFSKDRYHVDNHLSISIEVKIEDRCAAPSPMPHAAAVEQKADHSILNITTATLLVLLIRQLLG